MTNAHVKSEQMETSTIDFDPVNLESDILQLCLQFPNGVSDKILENSFRHVTVQQRLSAINRLLSLNRIDLLRPSDAPGTFICRIRDTNNTSRNETIDQKEKAVYQLVKENGNLGIWMRDIRFKTKLSPIILSKTLKSLESKKLIKAVKSVHANKKKVTN